MCPWRQQRAKSLRSFNVVLDQVVADAAEQIDLQARDRRAPDDRRNPHQMRFAAAGSAAEQNFGGYRFKRHTLFLVQLGEAAMDRGAALFFSRRLAAYKSCLAGAMLTNDMQEGAQFSVPPPVSRKKSACTSPSCAASASAAASDSSRASSASISSGLNSVSFLLMMEASIICSGLP